MPDPSQIAQTLALSLDAASGRPLSRQIVDRLWLEVIDGTLESGDRLPTVRQLAVALGLRPGDVQRAYNELERLGVLTVRSDGAFVSLDAPDPGVRERHARLEQVCRDAVTRAEVLGFDLSAVIDMLDEMRQARPGAAGAESLE